MGLGKAHGCHDCHGSVVAEMPRGARVYAVNCSATQFMELPPKRSEAHVKIHGLSYEKFKMTDVKGLQIHNQREKSFKSRYYSRTNGTEL